MISAKRIKSTIARLSLALAVVVFGCVLSHRPQDAISDHSRGSEGHTSVDRSPIPTASREAVSAEGIIIQPRLGAPLRGLTKEQTDRFEAGRAAFTRIIKEEDGLGPVHNLYSCAVCHVDPIGGSGSITVTNFGRSSPDGFDPLNDLGGPLFQSESTAEHCRERLPRDANVIVARISSSALGAGLIESIPDVAIKGGAGDPSPGVSGRVHWVHAIEDGPGSDPKAGRFGWKSQIATVRSFCARSAHMELGLTSEYYPVDVAPNGDTDLLKVCDTVADPEDVADSDGFTFVDRVTDFLRFLAPPPQTPRSGMLGEAIFTRIGCADCHTPSFTTRDDPGLESALRNRLIKPYSDFLLHDVGALGDGIAEGDAGTREMRTAPLWGFRIRFPVLHDGRIAGSTLSARATRSILAHDGEAVESVRKFEALSSEDVEKLIAFLDSLGRVEFDGDGDNDVDNDDWRAFASCFSGDGPPAYRPDDRCSIFDIDQDGDVDGIDQAAFAEAFTGPLYGSTMVVP